MATSGRPRGVRVRTSCTTEDELVALYQRDCDDVSIFLATDKQLTDGGEVAFSLELANGTPMVRGLGVVINAWRTADNRFGRAGAHIAFVQLTSASEPVLERMLELRAIAMAEPRKRTGNTQIRFGVVPSPSALANWPDEESVVGDVRRSITGEQQAIEPSTGTPATLVEGPASNTARYEGPIRAPAIPAPRLPPIPRQVPPLPNAMGLAPAVPITPATPAAPSPPPSSPTPQALGAAPIVPVAVATLPQDAPTQPRAPIVVPPEPAPAFARGSSPATPVLARSSSPALDTGSIALLPIPPPPQTGIDLVPLTDDLDALPPTPIARARRWCASQLSRALAGLAGASRWTAQRVGPTYRRVVEWLAPHVRAVWQSRARTPLVFAAGILVGVIVAGWLRSPPPASAPVAAVVPMPAQLGQPQRCAADTQVAAIEPVVDAAPTAPHKRVAPKQGATKSSPSTTTITKPASTPATTPSIAPKPGAMAVTRPAPTTKPGAMAATKPAPAIAKPAPATATKPATIATKATPATIATKATPATKPATIATKATPATKPATIATKPTPATKPATIATKPAPATKPATIATKPKPAAVTKPAAATKPAARPATAAQPAKQPASAATAPKLKAKPASPKQRCDSLDCI